MYCVLSTTERNYLSCTCTKLCNILIQQQWIAFYCWYLQNYADWLKIDWLYALRQNTTSTAVTKRPLQPRSDTLSSVSLYRDVSATALKKLPAEGLESVLVLFAQSAYALKSLPPLQGLWSLREAHLTYNSHCCALLSWSTHRWLKLHILQANQGSIGEWISKL